VATAAKAHAKAVASGSESQTAFLQADAEFRKTQAAFDLIDVKRKAADKLAALRRADFEYYKDKLDLDQLHERKGRIDVAREKAAEAQKSLSLNKVDRRVLTAIEKAELELVAATAQFQIGAPSMLLRGLTDCRVSVDELELQLRDGETRTISVTGKTRLTVPRVVEIEIAAGSGTEELSRTVDEARRALSDLCDQAGIAAPEAARSAFVERQEATRALESKAQVEKNDLRDLTYDDLTVRLIGLQQAVSGYLANRTSEPFISANLDSAKYEREGAEAALHEIVGQWESAREALDTSRSVRDELNTRYNKLQVQIDLLCDGLKQARGNLDAAREKIADADLEAALSTAAHAAVLAEGSFRAVEDSLKARNPERVRALEEAAGGSLRMTQNRRQTAQTELTGVQTRLKIHGEDGLHERLQTAQTVRERRAGECQSLARRASAAKRLFETMREERDSVRRAYLAPLKGRIEHLGRLIFDDSFQAGVGEDLQITSRTLKGVTIPFDWLSGGTREQLSLIFRSACAMIVAQSGGTPLLLDDALGYTDPDRLRVMGAVLATAAKECQIVIFTCMPERYAYVGEACVVALR
jgi:flagellar hook-basal body complex protein FliE